MKTLSVNIDVALNRANAVSATIKAYVVTEIDRWVKLQVKIFRWDFMKAEATAAIVKTDNSITLETDYWKMSSVIVETSNGDRTKVEVKGREYFDKLTDLTTQGLPYICCIFGTELRFFYAADKAYTLKYTYYKTQEDLTEDKKAPFPDRIIEQAAYIFALQYDRVDTIGQERILKDMLANLRRGSGDFGVSGEVIELEPNVFSKPPTNYI